MVFSILLATIPLAIAGFSIIQIYQKDLKKSIFEMGEMKANMVVEKMEAFFDKVTSNLLFLARDENFRKSGLSHTKGHLENLLYRNDSLMELTLLNEKGRETVKVSKYKVMGPSDLKDQSKSEMFRVASKGEMFYGEVRVSQDEIPLMIIALPIEEYKGKTIGILAAQIHLQCLWDVVSETKIGEKGFAYVVDNEGTLVAHPEARRVLMKENVSYLCGTRCHIQKESVFEWGWPSGERFLNVYKRIETLNWIVIVQVPVEEAYGPIKQITHTSLKWILIAFTMAVIFSLLLTRKITLPIKNLSKEMGEVAKGNLDTHIRATTQDEVGVLTESFNQMIQNLKESHEALKEAEEKYRKIFEDSKDMVYITSVDGRFIGVNQAGVEMFGYGSKEELMQIQVRDTYLNPEERRRFRTEIKKEGFVKDFEAKLKKRDGTPIDVLITANIRKDPSGDIVGYEGTIKNISERKMVEEELLQRKEELQTLYDLSVLINQALDLNDFFPIALERASNLTGLEMGGIYLYSEDRESLELKSYKGYSTVLAESVKVLKYGEGVCGRAIELKRPIVLSINEYPSPRILPSLVEEGIQTLVGVPLLSKGKAIGAITLSSRSVRNLTPREIHLLESLGNQIGLALENAKLFSNVAKAKSEWETTFDAVTDLITIRDRDYRIIRANKAAFKRYGMKPEEMIGKRCFETLHQGNMPCEGCYVSETLRTKKPASGERESKYLNGIFRYFTFPVYNEVGEVTGVVDLAREITEEKRLEIEKEVLNNINRILASSLDVRQVMKAVHSELKRVLDSERMTITLLEERGEGFRYFALEKDYEAGELVEGVVYPKEKTAFGKAVDTGAPVIVKDTAIKDSWINEKLLQEGIRSSLVFPLEYKGKVIGTLNFGSREPDYFHERHLDLIRQIVPGLAISIQNALLLSEIKGSEEKYRAVVEGAHDGICVIGMDNRFRYINKRMAEIMGYPLEELIGMDFREVLDEESKALVTDRYIRRQRGEAVTSRYEFNVVRKDGEIRNAEISSNIIKDSQGNIHTIAFIKDITEGKRMEEQLLQTEKLRALGEMASGVAHDFNNALAAILGNTQLLLYSVQEEEVRESLKTIEKVARDSAQTVKRLQEFTRKRAHQELFQVDVNAVIKDVIELTRPKWKDEAQGRGIQIEMISNLGEVPPVGGSNSEMREVITNLIFNAIEAMPEGGRIEVRTFQKDGSVHIRIADTGIGMNEEVRKKIFEPFFTTKPFSNTGLGLSMSYGIIKRFGGEIEVESKVGSGTAFTIILPIGGEGREEAVSPLTVIKGKEARILIIDDEETVRSVLARTLAQVHHQVTVAEDGERGIQLFKEGEFDMVLTDLGMPGLSGWEVCKRIKEMSPRTPIGMITGWGMELSQDKIKEAGLDFLISKPFDFNQILKIVAETIESNEKRI